MKSKDITTLNQFVNEASNFRANASTNGTLVAQCVGTIEGSTIILSWNDQDSDWDIIMPNA